MQGSGKDGADMRTSFLKSRLAKLPHLPAIAPGSSADLGSRSQAVSSSSSAQQVEDAAEDEERDSFGAMPPPRQPRPGRLRNVEQDDWTPLSAEGCFAEALEVDVHYPIQLDGAGSQAGPSETASGSGTFRVYYTPPARKSSQKPKARPPRARAQVGADGTPSESALLSLEPLDLHDDGDEEMDGSSAAADDDDPGTVFFLLHGAGFSALSWALMAREITKLTRGEAGVLAADCRGHGRTRHPDLPLPLDMSLDALTADMVGVLRAVFPAGTKVPSLVLVGHSMGGSVAVSLAHALLPPASSGRAPPIPGVRLTGVAVLDVVEGTAMDALAGMEAIVKAQPQIFASVEDAIRWHVESNTIQNRESARRSVPPLVVPNPNFKPGAVSRADEEVMEEMQDEQPSGAEAGADTLSTTSHPYIWRADLLSSAPYWSGWFSGLSGRFLSARCARLLLLAGTDRLDTDLMIGQMQGKYQLAVYQDVGHCLQEDAPARTAQTLVDFWRRNESVKVKRMVPGTGVKQDIELHKVGQ